MSGDRTRILLVSTVPSTLWAFFRRLPLYARQRGFEISVASADGPELKLFRDQFGTATYTIHLARKISPIADLRSIFRLARVMKRECFGVVHAHTPKAGLVGMLAARLAGVRHRIYTIHGFPAETAKGLTRRLLLLAERTAASAAHATLAVSRSCSDVVRSAGVALEPKLRVLGDGSSCGVDIERFSRTPDAVARAQGKRCEFGIPQDAQVMGFVGRLVCDKGIDVTVDAFLRLCETRDDLYLLLLGDFEPHRGRVPQRTIDSIEAHPRIKRVPFDWNPVPYYIAMDVLVLATLREGLPYALLEAAALQVPAVATRATGCVDAIVDGQTGFLVDIGDVEGVVRATKTLLDDEELRRRMGTAGRARVVECFPDERLLEEHVNLYRSLASERYGSAPATGNAWQKLHQPR